MPADMVLVHSAGPKGTCFVETKSLDGETNLKIKSTQRAIQDFFKPSDPYGPDLSDIRA